ncbi:hypothetical protein DAEQUDRAFT_532508 [Daedalea quercina L-15889]|uniref:Uncharacterized protein n=1 Tax=Daedalea quercina L-15889 TaxID=1314783 RepID=A0A165M6H7_9APHY|nr:hypothetical protein DAEQUDRAFT_532508 [Daedalea quercina L-15889]
MSVASSSASIGRGNYAGKSQGFPARIPGATPQQIHGHGGNWGTMFAGMGIVAVGLVSFYMAQFSIQGKRTPSTVKNLTEIPTWQLRHAQQQPGALPDLPKAVDDNYTRFTPNFQPKPEASLPLPGKDMNSRAVVSTILSALHDDKQGKGSADNDNHPRRIPQPAMTKRQEGRMYTKNTDYKDGFKPV